MTNEVAIKILQKLYEGCNKHKNTDLIKEAYNIAIEALKAQIATDTNVGTKDGDTIYRQAAISMKRLLEDWTGKEYEAVLVEDIEQLPSAQPEKVKCKKCRYVYYDKEFGNYWCNRMSGSFMVEEDGYCKWGK